MYDHYNKLKNIIHEHIYHFRKFENISLKIVISKVHLQSILRK